MQTYDYSWLIQKLFLNVDENDDNDNKQNPIFDEMEVDKDVYTGIISCYWKVDCIHCICIT